MLEKLSLDGKTIVITGGGTGLGRAMCVAMAKAGADMVIASQRLGPHCSRAAAKMIEKSEGLNRLSRIMMRNCPPKSPRIFMPVSRCPRLSLNMSCDCY